MDNNREKESIYASLRKEIGFPRTNYCLCGSLLEGRKTRGVDIDVICWSDCVSYVYSERVIAGDALYHLILFPRYKLLDYLICDVCSWGQVLTDMWKSCCDLDDSGVIVSSIQEYLRKMETHYVISSDDYIYYQINRIQSLCDNLSCPDNNPLLLASELLLAINGLIAGKQFDTKHLAREVRTNAASKRFQFLFREAAAKEDYSVFVNEVRLFIQQFSINNNASTTGLSYNKISGSFLIVYFPGVRKDGKDEVALRNLESTIRKTTECFLYSFRIESNQALDAGLYLCVHGKGTSLKSAYSSILLFHKQVMGILLKNNIKMLYPYRTAFSSGFYFGGIGLQEHLTPLFSELSSIFHRNIEGPEQAIYSVYDSFANTLSNGLLFLENVRDSIIVDVIDPVGEFNVDQLDMITSKFAKATIEGRDVPIRFDGFGSLRRTVKKILLFVLSLSDNDILFPALSASGNRHETLLRYILLHIQDIMRLSFQERYNSLSVFLFNNR